MSATGPSYDILGFSVGGSPPVAALVHLGIEDGLTALYGLNGVGKSRVLSLVEMALSGFVDDEDLGDEDDEERRDASTFDVHLRLHAHVGDGGETPSDPDFQEVIAIAIRRLQESMGLGTGPTDPTYMGLSGLVDLRLLQLRRSYLEIVEKVSSDDEREALLHQVDAGMEMWGAALEEASERGRLTLRAFGTAARPSWMVYLALSVRDPAGARALGEGRQWFSDIREQLQRPELGVTLNTREPLSTDSHNYLRGEYGEAEQVPMVKIGIIDAELDEDVHVPDAGRLRRLRLTRPGLRLADVVGPLTDPDDLDAATLEDLLAFTGDVYSGFLNENGSVDTYVAAEISARTQMADELLAQLLPGSPRLSFEVGSPEDWIRGVPPGWCADGLHISTMPSSQLVWARYAISLTNVCRRDAEVGEDAFETVRRRPLVFLCDEPERGLHRLLEHHLAAGISGAMRSLGGTSLVATHAPSMLASPLVRPVLVTRYPPGVRLRPVGLSIADGVSAVRSAEELGLTVGDLWALTRLTVVVEGLHDELVFKTLLRDDFDAATAAVLPIHGGARLRSLADAQMIVNGTDSPILIVLDDLDSEVASTALAQIRSADSTGDQAALREALEDLRSRGRENDSLLFLHQFASAAVKIGSLQRVRIHGLSLPDVICYLDSDTILSEPYDWEDLIDRWGAESAPRPARNIKAWLGRRHLLPQDHEAINERVEIAALQMKQEGRALHPDLVELGLSVRELSATRGV